MVIRYRGRPWTVRVSCASIVSSQVQQIPRAVRRRIYWDILRRCAANWRSPPLPPTGADWTSTPFAAAANFLLDVSGTPVAMPAGLLFAFLRIFRVADDARIMLR